jgi:hypothetical protein
MSAFVWAWILRRTGLYRLPFIRVSDRGRFRVGPRTYNWSNGRITSDRDDVGKHLRRGADGRWRLHATFAGQRWAWPR